MHLPLGSILSKSIVIDEEVNTRHAIASAAFGRLNRNVWNQRGIPKATKIKVYQAVVHFMAMKREQLINGI